VTPLYSVGARTSNSCMSELPATIGASPFCIQPDVQRH
jgi:hypothetical protein